MKHLFQPLSEVPHAANPRTSRNPADIVRLLVFLTTGTLFLPAVTAATSVVALIDNTNHRVVIAADCRVNRQLASLSSARSLTNLAVQLQWQVSTRRKQRRSICGNLPRPPASTQVTYERGRKRFSGFQEFHTKERFVTFATQIQATLAER